MVQCHELIIFHWVLWYKSYYFGLLSLSLLKFFLQDIPNEALLLNSFVLFLAWIICIFRMLVYVGASVCVCVCVWVGALRIVSRDKILHFKILLLLFGGMYRLLVSAMQCKPCAITLDSFHGNVSDQ